MIARVAGERLAKVCLELGGKNPLVVCDDANLEQAAMAAALSAFSNAGQRCAAGSRLIVVDAVYDRFRELLLERTAAQKVGPADEHDFGPVINERQLESMLAAVERAKAAGATVLTGGERLPQPGFYMAPTIVEGAAPDSEIACTELFGPIATLHRVADFEEALTVANSSPYGLTAAIWTASIHRAREFVRRIVAGGRAGQRPDLRLRAAHPVRRSARLGHRLARAGHRGARRLLGLEGRVRHARPGRGLRVSGRRAGARHSAIRRRLSCASSRLAPGTLARSDRGERSNDVAQPTLARISSTAAGV